MVRIYCSTILLITLWLVIKPVMAQTKILEIVQNHQLDGKSRAEVIKLIGQPNRSDEVMPGSSDATILDFYHLNEKPESQLRIDYDAGVKEVGFFIEPKNDKSLLALSSALASNSVLPKVKLRAFLDRGPNQIQQMSANQIENSLGHPGRLWLEEVNMGGRTVHWQNYIYLLSNDASRVLWLRIDDSQKHVYDYRIESLNPKLP